MPQEVIPYDTDRPQVLHALVRKRAEIAGQIKHAQLGLRQLANELDHIDAAIGIFNPSVDVCAICPKLPRHNPIFNGEITRVVFGILRDAPKPISTREITVLLVKKRGFDSDNKAMANLMIKRVRACLSRQRKRGYVRCITASNGLQGLWEVAL